METTRLLHSTKYEKAKRMPRAKEKRERSKKTSWPENTKLQSDDVATSTSKDGRKRWRETEEVEDEVCREQGRGAERNGSSGTAKAGSQGFFLMTERRQTTGVSCVAFVGFLGQGLLGSRLWL